jgi:NAD(P)H-flavin reductase
VSERVLRVGSVRTATPSSRVVRVQLAGTALPFRPGQSVMLGPASQSTRVPYSIACSPEDVARDSTLEFLIKTDAAGRWGEDFPPLRRGARLGVRGPVGTFVFPESPRERRFLFIAGGTGIAPLRSMIRHAIAAPVPGRMRLLYSARTPDDFAYLPELRGMARRGEIQLSLTATRHMTPRWRGSKGRIVPPQLAQLVDDPATLCFICGPASMVEDIPPWLTQFGVEKSRILLEDWEDRAEVR